MQVIGQTTNGNWMQRYWRNMRIRSIIPYLIFLALLIAAIAILGGKIKHHIDVIEEWISNLGLLGFFAYIILFVLLTSVFLPDTVFGILAGTLFGLGMGFAAVSIGALAASAVQYWLSRSLLKNRIERLIASKPNLVLIRQALSRQEFKLQILLRLTPISPVMISYLLGASGVKFFGFLIACIGLLPTFFFEVYFGYAGRHIAMMASQNKLTVVLHNATVIGGFISLIIVMFFVSRITRKAIEAAIPPQNNAQ
jgi:uncharacterized membrane protein YdjX (TVP38/TMEM64 family)